MTLILGVLSGIIVGFVLGLVGGGGSILAVPLLAHVVGVASPHVAIGTSAVAVALNAVLNLVHHMRAGAVMWRCASLFAVAGVVGAAGGAALGKAWDGQKLLTLFGLLMMVVGFLMLRPRPQGDGSWTRLSRDSALELGPRLGGLGLATGAASGFFGIGGGFLIVPALIRATRMPLSAAVASSLVAVAAFGATTALSYASAGLVDWPLAAVFVVGGFVGGYFGAASSRRLSSTAWLGRIFAALVIAVGLYVSARGFAAWA